MPRLPKSLVKPPTLDDMQPKDDHSVIIARIARLEASLAVMARYIVEKDQLRSPGYYADIVMVAKQHTKE